MPTNPLAAGKLPPDLLAGLLARLPPAGTEVVVGPAPGEDAAVVEIEGRYLVFASDPVTLSARPGFFAVHVNANDIAVMGARPRWLLASLIFPSGSTAEAVSAVMEDLTAQCAALEITLLGGHTEISASVRQPVVAATMIGETFPDRLVTSAGARPGDVLLLAGPIAVEGTAILAREHGDALRRRGVPEETVARAASLLDRPGISVLPAARALTGAAFPHAMHDPTEGGLLSAAREVALASRVGLRIDAARVPIFPETRAICAALDLDPLALLASGSLLAAVVPADVEPALAAWKEAGIEAAAIGEMLPADEGIALVRDGVAAPFPGVERDELARWLEEG